MFPSPTGKSRATLPTPGLRNTQSRPREPPPPLPHAFLYSSLPKLDHDASVLRKKCILQRSLPRDNRQGDMPRSLGKLRQTIFKHSQRSPRTAPECAPQQSPYGQRLPAYAIFPPKPRALGKSVHCLLLDGEVFANGRLSHVLWSSRSSGNLKLFLNTRLIHGVTLKGVQICG